MVLVGSGGRGGRKEGGRDVKEEQVGAGGGEGRRGKRPVRGSSANPNRARHPGRSLSRPPRSGVSGSWMWKALSAAGQSRGAQPQHQVGASRSPHTRQGGPARSAKGRSWESFGVPFPRFAFK